MSVQASAVWVSSNTATVSGGIGVSVGVAVSVGVSVGDSVGVDMSVSVAAGVCVGVGDDVPSGRDTVAIITSTTTAAIATIAVAPTPDNGFPFGGFQ